MDCNKFRISGYSYEQQNLRNLSCTQYSGSTPLLLVCHRFESWGFCWEMIAHAHIDADHRVMSHDGEKLLSVDTYTG
jgi:hypothetical protein